MTTQVPRTVDAIRQAMEDNRAEPEGTARNARAERLAEEAERTGDRPLLIEALFNLLTAYNYSSESDKKFVPFAKALRMWDENPADFDEFTGHSLHWYFKWVSSGMLDQPHIPLSSIEKWQREMEHRYRLAGHSERAVRQGEFRIARHIGDLERARLAYARWQSADRDRMSDCHACELHLQGAWQAQLGDDKEALASWQPVLAGEQSCAHEPHGVLASSLLPLLRLGRLDEARGNHLRGYRLVRAMESMRASVAQHVEFCALTGNEARGLEILAQHPSYFTATGDPDSLLDHLAATAVLTRRLTGLGHGEEPVPGPEGRQWTAAALHGHVRAQATALARQFDARNGTSAVSAALRERLARQPFTQRLPLGLRAARLSRPPATAPAPPQTQPEPVAADATAPVDLPGLLAEARRLREVGHPRAHEAWAAVELAVERDGLVLDARARAEIADHAAMAAIGEPERSAALFRDAARQFEAAGEPGEAAACRARAGYALTLTGAGDGLAAVEKQCALLHALHGQGRATARQLTGAQLLRCRILLQTGEQAAAGQQAAEAAEFARRYQDEPGLPGRLADAEVLLGRLAMERGDTDRAVELLTRAAELCHREMQPWFAAEPENALAGLLLDGGDPAGAVRSALAALDHGGEILEPPHRVHLHLLLARAHTALGDDEQTAAHALDAAQWAEEAGEDEGAGATARLMFGGALLRLGRTEESASVLESVLPELERCHDEGEVVQARWWLAECQLALGEAREAAEQLLRAARIAEGWDEPHDHAMLANLAADALNRAGLHDEAVLAYERAEQLWRAIGDPHAVVRTLRARAWIEQRDGRGGLPAARPLMAAAARAAARALDVAADEESAAHLRSDLADTYRQTAEIVIRGCTTSPAEDPAAVPPYEEAMALADLAAQTLAPLGPQARDDRTAALLMAGWLDADLGRPSAAAARAREVTAAYADATGSLPDARRAEAASILDFTSKEA
jgi:tetratricopeptide (TPR) repeat protein